jgi:hypothetical protein
MTISGVLHKLRFSRSRGKIAGMFKNASSSKPTEQRLFKVAAKRVRVANLRRARFLAEVRATQPTESSAREVVRLVERVRAAKAAPFLEQYRLGK